MSNWITHPKFGVEKMANLDNVKTITISNMAIFFDDVYWEYFQDKNDCTAYLKELHECILKNKNDQTI